MPENEKNRSEKAGTSRLEPLIAANRALLVSLFEDSGAAHWEITLEQFTSALVRSGSKRFAGEEATKENLQQYFSTLHLQDLALAAACIDGRDAAWNHFVATYRDYLRAGARAILKSQGGAANAAELADSLFAELFGLADRKTGERSLLRYFHGRSSLRTWLRAVLAQRHIDGIRASRRFDALETEDGQQSPRLLESAGATTPLDPHRERYVRLFFLALQQGMKQLDPRDRERLRLYYAEEQTLAVIGRALAEHESSVSRNLDRVRRELRASVEEILRAGAPTVNGSAAETGLSDAEIALCFEYSGEDSPLDLQKLFSRPQKLNPAGSSES